MENIISNYNMFSPVDNANRVIIDYLFKNSVDLWKLLKYIDNKPLTHKNLSDTQKKQMICKDLFVDGVTTEKNVLFQLNTDEGFSVAIPQLRIEIGDIVAINDYQGFVEIIFQIIVPNKINIIQTSYNDVAYRNIAIFRELVKALNGKQIPNSGFNSPMFINKNAPYGAGRRTGAFKATYNKEYSGYDAIFSVLV